MYEDGDGEDYAGQTGFRERTDFLFQLQMQYNMVRQELSRFHVKGRSEKAPDDAMMVLSIMVSRETILKKSKRVKNKEDLTSKLKAIENEFKGKPDADQSILLKKFELMTQILDDAGLLGLEQTIHSTV